jgi:hypothetical protein
MPLRTWLAGDFRTTWGGETSTGSRRRRSDEDAVALRESLVASLEPLIGSHPEWDEIGPARSALAVSAESFALPFLLARRLFYRVKMPLLATLEGPQVWLPAPFEASPSVVTPWSEEETLMVASLPRVRAELELLLKTIRAEESPESPDLQGAFYVGGRLLGVAIDAEQARMPVIVEG